MLAFLVLLLATLKYTKLSQVAVWGLSVWGFLHMAGGGVPVGDSVLYAWHIWPLVDRGEEFFILKFDQVVHAFGFAVATLVMYEVMSPHWRGSRGLLSFAAFCAGMGLGALNEIVEFAAVVVFPSTGVGGYYNTGLDLVFNALGAGLMAITLYLWLKPLQAIRPNF
jgi:putative membrane protein